MASPSRTDAFGEYGGIRGFVRQAFVTGTAVTLPLIVTLIVLGIVVNFVSAQLNPVVGLFTSATGVEPASEITIKLTAILALLGLIFLVGAVAERRPGTSGFGVFFDTLVSRIPGIGSLYQGVEEMSNMLLDSDTDSFREVKLVEFPTPGSYALAFQTADTPDVIEEAADREGMVTLFLPLAPNPVMGGYVLHVSEERVVDVDMSVEEGIQSIVTSGVATGHHAEEELPEDVLARLHRRLDAIDTVVGIDELERYAADASSQLEEAAWGDVLTPRSRLEDEADSDGKRDETDRGKDEPTG